VYPKNLDKQDVSKLIVAQTVPALRVCADTAANKYINNVRVNGILVSSDADPFFLLGALNGAVADFVFKRIAKPKRGGYFEANKQFIAPLPIPKASPEQQSAIAALARALQSSWTRRRNIIEEAENRLSVLPRARHGEHWLWPDIPMPAALEAEAPHALRFPAERQEWAKQRLREIVDTRIDILQTALDGQRQFEVSLLNGELSLFANGSAILDRVYLDAGPGRLAENYWRFLLLKQEWRDAAKLAEALRRPPNEAEVPAARQFMDHVDALSELNAVILAKEREMEDALYALYGLTEDERLLVEAAARSHHKSTNRG
jgi:hypothetical protein